jgi:hypothetical protein
VGCPRKAAGRAQAAAEDTESTDENRPVQSFRPPAWHDSNVAP